MADFPAITHVALTVTDLEHSATWYEALLGVSPALDEDGGGFYHKVYPLAGGMLLGLHTHSEPGGGAFDAASPGLDHLAFGVGSRDDLAKWESRLDELGIEHGGIVDAHYGSGLSFKDPDGLALELFAPPE